MIDGLYVIAPSGANELAHHGVKGMKWGVRRYQNFDGSLTPQGQKKVRKIQRYRNKFANKANANYIEKRSEASDWRRMHKDLSSNGMESDTWKRLVKRQRQAAVNSHGVILGNLDSAFFNNESNFRTAMSAVREQQERYEKSAKAWKRTHKALMNMPIDELTTKRDVRSVYKYS